MGRKKAFENRPDVILAAADKLFGTKGFAQTNVTDIAKEAGISKASVYLDFSTKEEILQRVILRAMNEFNGVMRERLNRPEPSHIAAIHEAVAGMMMAIYHHSSRHGFRHDSLFLVDIPQVPMKEKDETLWAMYPMVTHALQQAAGAGEIPQQPNFERCSHLLLYPLLRICAPPHDPLMIAKDYAPLVDHTLTVMLTGLKHQVLDVPVYVP
ncbi:MAG: TetR/AcrR family transcriptional regulator [Candidatus Melainabacteria bacterium]